MQGTRRRGVDAFRLALVLALAVFPFCSALPPALAAGGGMPEEHSPPWAEETSKLCWRRCSNRERASVRFSFPLRPYVLSATERDAFPTEVVDNPQPERARLNGCGTCLRI